MPGMRACSYVLLYDGIVSKNWNKFRLYIIRVLIIQAVPVGCLITFAYGGAGVCNEAFCQVGVGVFRTHML